MTSPPRKGDTHHSLKMHLLERLFKQIPVSVMRSASRGQPQLGKEANYSLRAE